MIDVTLLIRSGLPNPRWALDRLETRVFLARILEGGATILDPDEGDFRLGYDGFIIEASGWEAARLHAEGLPARFRIAAERSGAATADGVAAEQSLLGSGRVLSENLLAGMSDRLEEISKRISLESRDIASIADEELTDGESNDGEYEASTEEVGQVSLDEQAMRAGGCLLYTTSNSNFDFWNADRTHRENNNCYNYGSNWRTNTFAQPGLGGTGRAYHWDAAIDDAGAALQGCLNDGFVQANPCTGIKQLKLALVVRPRNHPDGADFHFYRRVRGDNRGNRWAHKRGQTPAKNTDESGRWIRNPRHADRGGYEFVAWLYHPSNRDRVIR